MRHDGPLSESGFTGSAVESAQRASLSYVSDAAPGFRRRRSGRGFSYVGPNGRAVGKEALQRIHELVIPPAWTDVWISSDPDGHIQATGRDQRGRKQYRYHDRWSACRDEVKYTSLVDFARVLPKLRDAVDRDLRKRGVPRERVVASIVWLLDNAMIRVGNASYARDNKSFGLTTLRSRHVRIEGSAVRFAFRGKSGKEWKLDLVDRRIARIIRGVQELPGQQLFQYLNEDGDRRPVSSQEVNDYIREVTGADFSSKHFRTWGGTVRAAALFAETPLPESKTETARTLNGLIDQVAARLGNTRAVCRKCYIHPNVIAAWQEGRLHDELADAARSRRKPIDGLDEEERLVLSWLDRSKR